jgi:CheY-specific phosphatase CheX
MQAGKPFLKGKTPWSQGDVTDIVGITGDMHGSLAVGFSKAAILQVVSNMFSKACKEMSDEVRAAVGVSTNMICGRRGVSWQNKSTNFEALFLQ